MKIYQKHNTDVTRIDFCCGEMAEDVLIGEVKSSVWSDHIPAFYVNAGTHRIFLKHCHHCGAKIEGGKKA